MIVTRNDNPRGDAWAGTVALAALEAMNLGGIGLLRDVPVEVDATFYVPRPKGHFGSGRNAGVLKAGMPVFPAKKPDADKYLRNVLDALSGVVYFDDGQVVDALAHKRFGEPARAEIRVSVLSSADAVACADGVELSLFEAAA